MKTMAQIQAALDELRAVCRNHGIVLVGTCDAEGIFGEICIGEPSKDLNPQVDNELYEYIGSGEFFVRGIGDVP